MSSKPVLIFALIAALLACSGGTEHEVSNAKVDATTYESALNEVLKAQEEARKSGNEWTSAQGLIDHAAELAAEGQWQNAVARLDDARQQYELALIQSEREAEAWQDRVVR